ncbi:unnamed protein product [Prorocentrum cordatum]|uniref:Subtilisin n=1 Tax=Prorocentrum cordatum TaxID=2364126 RepID=A0ABN9TSZ4_9DINO|nr:unnamed protein product [Polarella glacialis]
MSAHNSPSLCASASTRSRVPSVRAPLGIWTKRCLPACMRSKRSPRMFCRCGSPVPATAPMLAPTITGTGVGALVTPAVEPAAPTEGAVSVGATVIRGSALQSEAAIAWFVSASMVSAMTAIAEVRDAALLLPTICTVKLVVTVTCESRESCRTAARSRSGWVVMAKPVISTSETDTFRVLARPVFLADT